MGEKTTHSGGLTIRVTNEERRIVVDDFLKLCEETGFSQPKMLSILISNYKAGRSPKEEDRVLLNEIKKLLCVGNDYGIVPAIEALRANKDVAMPENNAVSAENTNENKVEASVQTEAQTVEKPNSDLLSDVKEYRLINKLGDKFTLVAEYVRKHKPDATDEDILIFCVTAVSDEIKKEVEA